MKILLPIDESDCSLKTIEWVAHMFDKNIAEYYLLYVVPMPSGYIPAVPEFIPIISDSDMLESQSDLALKALNAAKAKLEKYGCNIAQSEFIVGDPVDEICKYANTWDVQQVILGSHGKSALQKIILGSVSSDVMKYCKKPVIIYRNLESGKAMFDE